MRQVREIEEFLKWRREVIECVFGEEPSDALMDANQVYFKEQFRRGNFYMVIGEVDKQEAGCGAVCFQEELPSPDNPFGRCAYLMNIYVRSGFRKRGVGSRIVSTLLAEARHRGCGRITLETTKDGRALYVKEGFADAPGFMIYKNKVSSYEQ